jgi:AcrR family transcriptional regulator
MAKRVTAAKLAKAAREPGARTTKAARPSAKAVKSGRSRPARKTYHHGDLAPALLRAAEVVLRRDGVERLTLRAVAREAGVSHTAPQHHFGDLTGLLSELAAVGFQRFRDMMLRDVADAPERDALPLGRGYIDFARANPDLFLLMFRSERLDMTRPTLRDSADASFAVLARARGIESTTDAWPLDRAARITAAWSLVHGLALLAIDGRLKGVLRIMHGRADENVLIDATLSLFRSR